MLSVCCPSLNNGWLDERTSCKEKGKHTYGTVRDLSTGFIYGNYSKDSNIDLVYKYFEIILANATFLPVLRLEARLLGLCTFDWIRTGIPLAKRQWLLYRQEWSMQQSQNLPGKKTFAALAVWFCLGQLIKNVTKAVMCVFAFPALILASLYGIFVNALSARKAISTIEYKLSRDLIKIPGSWNVCSMGISEIIAPCMQPKQIYENVIRPHFDMDEPTKHLNQCLSEIMFMQSFYRKEKINLIITNDMSDIWELWRTKAYLARKAKKSGKPDQELEKKMSDIEPKIVTHFQNIMGILNKCKKTREDIISAQLTSQQVPSVANYQTEIYEQILEIKFLLRTL